MVWVVVQLILLGALGASVMWRAGPPLFPFSTATAGQLLLSVGLVIAVAAFVSLRRAVKLSPYPRPDARLVETGIYRYLRHPMYTAAVVCSSGLVLVVPRVGVVAAAVAVTVFYLAKARFEESLLLARYPGYADYRARTLGVLLFRGK